MNDPEAPDEPNPLDADNSVAEGDSPSTAGQGSFVIDEMTADGGPVGQSDVTAAEPAPRDDAAGEAEPPKRIK